MRKNKIGIYALSALGLFGYVCGLASCDKSDNSSSSSESSSSSSSSESSSSIDGHFEKWSEADIALMNKYCGGALPYPTDMFVGEVSVNEIYDEQYDYSYLQISDEATSFSLAKYYETLEDFGWSTIKTYNGNVIQTDTSGIEFVESTKPSTDKSVGYDILYFFSPMQEGVSSANVIKVFNDLSAKETTDTAWSSSDLSTMNSTLTTTLPFIKLGEKHTISSTGTNSLEIFDYYVKDLTNEYSKLLQDDGFELNKVASRINDICFLTKTLDDGTFIQAYLYYNNGNVFIFSYTPKVKESSTWPSEIINEIKEKTEKSIPQFDIAEGGKYSYYKKGDTYCIYSDNRLDTFDYEKYAYNDLQNNLGLTWDEQLSFATYDRADSDGNVIGFQLFINVTKPTSTFVDSYPTEQISNAITSVLSLDKDILPSFDTSSIPATGEKIKYEVRGEEYYQERYAYYYQDITNLPGYYGFEDTPSADVIDALAKKLAYQDKGIKVGIYDVNSATWKSYTKTLYEEGWYYYIDRDDHDTYEDPTGKIAVTFSGNSDPSYDGVGATYFTIHNGTGEAHTPSLKYAEEEYSLAIGQKNKELDLRISMLPYKVTYSSSDMSGMISVNENGEVTVSENATAGMSATITAKVTTKEGKEYSASCKVTVKDGIYYDIDSLVSKVSSLLTSKGYEPKSLKSKWMDYVTADLGDLSVTNAKKLIEESLIPNGFTKYSDDWEKGSIYAPYEKDGEIKEEEKENGYTIRYTIYNDFCSLVLDFSFYVENGKTYLVVFVF